MCGRYVSFSDPDQLAQLFRVDEVKTDPLPPRYNVAPTLEVYAVVDTAETRRLGTLQWGLVPFWAEDPKRAPSPINARLETLRSKRMFREPFERRRCLLPADGFYEWKQTAETTASGKPRKQPYYIHEAEGRPLAFAGVWSSWRSGEDPERRLYTCAIVTTTATGPMAQLHERMPLMLPGEAWEEWLDVEGTDADEVYELARTLDPPPLEAYPVTTRVNNVRNDGPELLARAD